MRYRHRNLPPAIKSKESNFSNGSCKCGCVFNSAQNLNLFCCIESLPEENELFVNDSSSSNSTYEKTKASQDSTYDTLHGVSTTTAQSHKEQVEYDIFDDLC